MTTKSTGSARSGRKAARPLLDRKGFRVAEEGFLDRCHANLQRLGGVFNPMDGRSYDASAANRVPKIRDERSSEVKGLIQKLVDRNLQDLYDEMPKNTIHVTEIGHKEMLRPRVTKVSVVAASFSPAEELIREGHSNRKGGSAELNEVKDLVAKDPGVFHLIGAFSATGWADGCQALLVGANYLIALVDIHEGAWRTYFAPDARWRGNAKLFDVTTDEEKIESIHQFVQRHTSELLLDKLTEEFVFDQLGYSIPVIRQAFEEIAAEDPFVRYDTGVRPYRLIRNYG